MLVILYQQCDMCQANAIEKWNSLSTYQRINAYKECRVSKVLSKDSLFCLQGQFSLFELNLLSERILVTIVLLRY